MPKVTVSHDSSLSPEEAFSKVKGVLDNDEQLKKLDSKYTFSADESNLTAEAKGSLFSANLSVTASGAGSCVEITIQLPLALSLVSGKVKSKLQEHLQQTLLS